MITLMGLALTGMSYALDQYYRNNIADKNGDGQRDWKDADVNVDGYISIGDISLLSANRGKPVTSANWRCDLNNDNSIDDYDASILESYWGMSLSIYNPQSRQGSFFIVGLATTAIGAVGYTYTRKKKQEWI